MKREKGNLLEEGKWLVCVEGGWGKIYVGGVSMRVVYFICINIL